MLELLECMLVGEDRRGHFHCGIAQISLSESGMCLGSAQMCQGQDEWAILVL
jgi:hypothetical protein